MGFKGRPKQWVDGNMSQFSLKIGTEPTCPSHITVPPVDMEKDCPKPHLQPPASLGPALAAVDGGH